MWNQLHGTADRSVTLCFVRACVCIPRVCRIPWLSLTTSPLPPYLPSHPRRLLSRVPSGGTPGLSSMQTSLVHGRGGGITAGERLPAKYKHSQLRVALFFFVLYEEWLRYIETIFREEGSLEFLRYGTITTCSRIQDVRVCIFNILSKEYAHHILPLFLPHNPPPLRSLFRLRAYLDDCRKNWDISYQQPPVECLTSALASINTTEISFTSLMKAMFNCAAVQEGAYYSAMFVCGTRIVSYLRCASVSHFRFPPFLPCILQMSSPHLHTLSRSFQSRLRKKPRVHELEPLLPVFALL